MRFRSIAASLRLVHGRFSSHSIHGLVRKELLFESSDSRARSVSMAARTAGQRVGGAVSQECRDEGRRDDVRPPCVRRPAQHDLTADVGEARLQVLDTRFAGVVPNHPPDRLRLEADVTPEAAVRHGSPALSPAAGAPADNARNSSTEETTRSATTTGAAGSDGGAAPADAAEPAGSSARMPADAGSGPSNGRANR